MKSVDTKTLHSIAQTLRYYALYMTTKAGSGHPTSGLSAADLLGTLWATQYRYDFTDPFAF
jgi:transketolase